MLVDELKKFLQSKRRNDWLFNKKVRVYTRKSTRYLNCVQYKCLDIANIEVFPQYQRQGIFKKVLQTWIVYSPYPVIFIENVLNEDFISVVDQTTAYPTMYSRQSLFLHFEESK